MNAIRYRWDGTRYRFIVEAIAEQPDGTAAVHLISKHETEQDAQLAALHARQERDNTNAALDAAQDDAARLRAALQAVEFASTYYGWQICPWCGRTQVYGHAPDCQRQAALAQTAQEVKA